jgi:hypothetical protein
MSRLSYAPFQSALPAATLAGFRTGDKGTHTSRTMMLAELSTILAAASPAASRADYASAIIDSNVLDKPTASSRRLTNQRIGELYALDSKVPLFGILRNLWFKDDAGRPLLALLVAIARDPLLAASAAPIITLRPDDELRKDPLREAIREVVHDRLNDAVLEKVVRNVSSSWAQSGHLLGRTFKRRVRVTPSPASIALALYIAWLAGYRGEELLDSPWTRVLDVTKTQTTELAIAAKRLGLIDVRIADRIVDISFRRLDPVGNVE